MRDIQGERGCKSQTERESLSQCALSRYPTRWMATGLFALGNECGVSLLDSLKAATHGYISLLTVHRCFSMPDCVLPLLMSLLGPYPALLLAFLLLCFLLFS